MTGRAEGADRTATRLAELLAAASTEAIGAAGGHAAGVYLRSGTPGLLRLAVLAGLPGPLFRPWWRMHVERRFPVADAYRLGLQLVLPNATEAMRRYPQFAAGLPFQFWSLYVPVAGARGGLDGEVAVAAVDSEVADVVAVIELNRLRTQLRSMPTSF